MIHRYLITYDIPDNRRRQKLHDLLSGYGQRVNDSVFEVTTN
ncbi:MAG: CRISPR-associated endonuclease Cas2 [Campylobacterales bacterium]